MLNHLMIDMLTTAKTPAIERLRYSSLFPIDHIPKFNSSFPGAIMVPINHNAYKFLLTAKFSCESAKV